MIPDPLGNTSGLTNKELIRAALENLLAEVKSGLVSQHTIELAEYALVATVRPKRKQAAE